MLFTALVYTIVHRDRKMAYGALRTLVVVWCALYISLDVGVPVDATLLPQEQENLFQSLITTLRPTVISIRTQFGIMYLPKPNDENSKTPIYDPAVDPNARNQYVYPVNEIKDNMIMNTNYLIVAPNKNRHSEGQMINTAYPNIIKSVGFIPTEVYMYTYFLPCAGRCVPQITDFVTKNKIKMFLGYSSTEWNEKNKEDYEASIKQLSNALTAQGGSLMKVDFPIVEKKRSVREHLFGNCCETVKETFLGFDDIQNQAPVKNVLAAVGA